MNDLARDDPGTLPAFNGDPSHCRRTEISLRDRTPSLHYFRITHERVRGSVITSLCLIVNERVCVKAHPVGVRREVTDMSAADLREEHTCLVRSEV